jgi:hypothetical protein
MKATITEIIHSHDKVTKFGTLHSTTLKLVASNHQATPTLRGNSYKVGDCINYEFTPLTTRFTERLQALGISVQLGGNYPWLYIDYINGVRVTEKLHAEHGFCAFTMSEKVGTRWSDRREVFKLIRKYVENSVDKV